MTIMNKKPFFRSILLIVSLFLITGTWGCSRFSAHYKWKKSPDLIRLSRGDMPNLNDDMSYEGLAEAIRQSVAYFKKIPSDRQFVFGKDRYDTGHMLESMTRFLAFIETKPSSKELRKYIGANYRVYQSKGYNPEKEVLFTGYYEPTLIGFPKKNKQNRYPVHSLPKDLLTADLSKFSEKYQGDKIVGRLSGKNILPYAERKEILSDPLFNEKAPPLAWVSDPVSLFFLHVQGSGRIIFPNGNGIRVHYRGTNGRPYKSIGKYLIETNKIPKDKMSMQAIRAYLQNHPHEVPHILNYNPSYVFFEKVSKGPMGCIQTQLVPGRSIALDRKTFPIAALAFIETQRPGDMDKGGIKSWIDFSRFVLNQDTGGAIKGPGRADIFWGGGDYAEIAAGYMKQPGKLYFFVLKPVDETA